jgi:hypothetical protein
MTLPVTWWKGDFDYWQAPHAPLKQLDVPTFFIFYICSKNKFPISLHIVSMMLFSSCFMCYERNLFEQTFLKKCLISVSVFHIPFVNKFLYEIGINICINTWQSWFFNPYNLHSSKHKSSYVQNISIRRLPTLKWFIYMILCFFV